MSMPRSSRRKSSAALLAACLFLEGALRPALVVFAQVVSEPVSESGSAAKDSNHLFLDSLSNQLVEFCCSSDVLKKSETDALLRMLSPGPNGAFPPPRELASALTIAEAWTHPETLPALLPRLGRMGRTGETGAELLAAKTRNFLWGSAADADSARRYLGKAILNIPGLQAQARADPESARILDALFDGKLASLGEAPAQAAASPAGGVGGPTLQKTAPMPAPLLSRAAESLRRTMLFGFEPTFTNKRMEKLYLAAPGAPEGYKRFNDYLTEKRTLLLKQLRMELGPTETADEWSFHDRVGKWNVDVDVGLIELQPPPQRFETILPQMTALFRSSQKAGLAAEIAFGGIYGGGGHIHLDKKIFEDNPLLLRNFVVDVHNRPYIKAVLEELGDDQAQSIREKGEELIFRAAIAGIDGELKRAGGRLSWKKILECFKLLHVYGNDRYRDVNLQNLVKEQYPPTVELRMHRAQRAPEDFRDLAEFWLYRLANLSLSKEPIPILDLDKGAVERMQMPSVAIHLWRKLVRESRLPRPERYERFAREKFPSPLRLGPARNPRVEIRFAGVDKYDRDIYEVLVKDPEIRVIQRMRTAVELSKASELPGRPRIGRFIVPKGEPDVISIEGVPGITSVDLSQARKEIDSYRVLRWRKVR